MRTALHPFLFEHKLRMCLTDRMHQSLTSHSHKRPECKQHLASIVKSLTHDRSTIMESLNARMRKYAHTLS